MSDMQSAPGTLIPAIAQEHRTGRVLMLAWMNDEALRRTLETGRAWYWSRSRQSMWCKGETSGNVQHVVEVRRDCDHDTILLLVEQTGPACHTNEPSCFFERLPDESTAAPPPATAVERLQRTIAARRDASPDSSWTARLLSKGLPKILEKVAEEAGELEQALREESDDRVVSEAADLLYHVLVGFEARGIDFADVQAELARRFGTSGIEEKASRSSQAE